MWVRGREGWKEEKMRTREDKIKADSAGLRFQS